MAFCKKRDKDDTDKAIYRMCCIGLVDDVTIDYLSQTYELKIHKRTDEEFKQYMLDFSVSIILWSKLRRRWMKLTNSQGVII